MTAESVPEERSAMTISVSHNGPTTLLQVEILRSVHIALKFASVNQKKTMGEITTDALIEYLTKKAKEKEGEVPEAAL